MPFSLYFQEALFGEEVTRAGLGRAEYYEDSHLIHSCDKVCFH